MIIDHFGILTRAVQSELLRPAVPKTHSKDGYLPPYPLPHHPPTPPAAPRPPMLDPTQSPLPGTVYYTNFLPPGV